MPLLIRAEDVNGLLSIEEAIVLVGRMPLKELPAERPTPIRTAATSAVGTRCLAREDSRVLGIIGAGGEAKYHLLALSKTRPFGVAKVYCRTQSTREQFCRDTGQDERGANYTIFKRRSGSRPRRRGQ
jgi:ornithine cyclodeaminase/alanine dehydrogenase-like protein (mu-crystallin family)